VADSKLSLLASMISSPGTIALGCNDSGTSKRITDLQLAEFIESRQQLGCLCAHSSNQTITTGSSWTTLNFDAEEFDIGSIHDTSTNNERLTAPVAGQWLFFAMIEWAAVAADFHMGVNVWHSGSTTVGGVESRNVNDATEKTSQSVAGLVNMASSSYLICQVRHNRGSDLDVVVAADTLFGMFLLGR
jgi:hypothetical protein